MSPEIVIKRSYHACGHVRDGHDHDDGHGDDGHGHGHGHGDQHDLPLHLQHSQFCKG